MQINNSVYVDIEIEDLNLKNFLQVEDLLDLQIIETAGASLPIIYASFLTAEQNIINHFVRKNTIIVKIGTSEQDCDTFSVSIYSSTPPNNGSQGDRRIVEFAGFVCNQDFMVNLKSETYPGTSLSVTENLLKEELGLINGNGFLKGIGKVNEKEVQWMRNNVTACQFLAEVLVHMDIRPSFPIFAFDKYGTFHLNDFNKMTKIGPRFNFVSRPAQNENEIQYFDNFSVDDYKDAYNLYSGFNKVTEIWKSDKGAVEYAKSYNEPVLASTKETDMLESSSRILMNTPQSANVHDTYVEAFTYNTNKLVALSSFEGILQLAGKYYKKLKPTDLVTVSTEGADVTLDGFYLIDTIRTKIDMKRNGLIKTFVYVVRDNKNNIENYIVNRQKGIKIRKKLFSDLINAISRLRVAYATGKKIIDGTYMKNVLSFALMTKRNLLRSFTVAGVSVDFNSSANLLKSLICVGNSLMNTLVSMIFPESIAEIFRDFIIRKPSLKALLYNYVAIYVPYEVRDLITSLLDSIIGTTDALNSIAKDNKITVTAGAVSGESAMRDGSAINSNVEGETVINNTDTSEIDYTEDNQERVGRIITDFEKNTTGVDIPFPIIELSESQSLMPDEALRNYVAQQTISNLTNLGYLDGFSNEDIEDFKEILLGEKEINFNTINRINNNAGNSYSYKFWGTYDSLIDLTDFYIKKCYKDKYRTIPCTKLINATDNAKIFFACPKSEENIKFYVNSKRTELKSFDIDLGYVNNYGNNIPYTVYYTETGFNSTSVLFEVKQGGMV